MIWRVTTAKVRASTHSPILGGNASQSGLGDPGNRHSNYQCSYLTWTVRYLTSAGWKGERRKWCTPRIKLRIWLEYTVHKPLSHKSQTKISLPIPSYNCQVVLLNWSPALQLTAQGWSAKCGFVAQCFVHWHSNHRSQFDPRQKSSFFLFLLAVFVKRLTVFITGSKFCEKLISRICTSTVEIW